MPLAKFITLFLLGLFVASPVWAAAAVTPEGAKDLQSRFAKELASRKDIKTAGMKSQFTGDVAVVARSTYYEATFPALKLTDAKNNTLNVGRVIMNMIPTDTVDEWKSSVALPETMNYKDARGKNSGTLTLGTQKASGIWDMKIFGMKKLDADYNNVTYKNDQTKEGFMAAHVTTGYDMIKSGDGISGPVHVTADNLYLTDAGGQATLLSPSVKIDTQVKADKAAPQGYTQTSAAEIAGLSTALNVIGQKIKDPNASGRMQLQKSLGMLSILQMSGKPVDGAPDSKKFDVVTDAQGRTMLNGVDVSLLMGAASLK